MNKSLLYSDVIENDGHIGSEPTILGAALIGIGLFVGIALIIVLTAAL